MLKSVDGGGMTMAMSWLAAAAMILAASAAAGFDLNASEGGTNGSSKLGNGRLLSEHAFSSVEIELAIKLDISTREDIGGVKCWQEDGIQNSFKGLFMPRTAGCWSAHQRNR